MNVAPSFSRRGFLGGGALAVAFSFAPARGRAATALAPARPVNASDASSYLAIAPDGSVTLYCGKVDLGQGLRIAMRQIAAEELGIGVDRIAYVEGDTALTPDQGRTSGSNGIQRGGMQVRRAAATLRAALVDRAARKLNQPAESLVVRDGRIGPKDGGASVGFADLLDGPRELPFDPKAALRSPSSYTLVGKSLPRPDIPDKCTGRHVFIQDMKVDNMAHARVVRPSSVGAELVSVDDKSIAAFKGAKIVRVKNFLAVVAEDEWTAVRAALALKATWKNAPTPLPDQGKLLEILRAGAVGEGEKLVAKGAAPAADAVAKKLSATYFWPIQSHASLGPSCAIADVRADSAVIWTASQGTHGNRATFARFLKLPPDKVRLIYVDGAGCYGMNGNEDAAADAAIISREIGRPVRVQWTREDELAWDPKGPPQLIDVAASLDAKGALLDWRTDLWIPQTTKGMPDIPLLGPADAGLDDVKGMNPGLIAGNGDPPYRSGAVALVAHWLNTTPLRVAPLRGPGKPGNTFAVESFTDELAAAGGIDPVEFRLRGLDNPRGLDVIRKCAAMMNWTPRTARSKAAGDIARGRGFSYVHYKHNETFVAMGMDVAVNRRTGQIAVEKVWCAHDCGQIINPDGVRAQVEGSIIQTLSRTLLEEVKFDRTRVTSANWTSYPILRFDQVPKIEIELLDRPNDPPLGAGEAACSCVPAAVGNGVFDALGVRLRTIPMVPQRVLAALTANG
ncbi:MAG: molybdopterin cofactor-binding domain-containing protein [Beijerinckiaceae bacterium]